MGIETLKWKQDGRRSFSQGIQVSQGHLIEEECHIMEITPSTHPVYILPLGCFLILVIYLHWFYQACITDTSI